MTGDFLAHRTGALLGDRLRTGNLGSRIPAAAWRQAEADGPPRWRSRCFLARFLPVVRTLTPHLAGHRLPYHRIAPYSTAAAAPCGPPPDRHRLCGTRHGHLKVRPVGMDTWGALG
ncbi:hypothetical protein SPURM210S_01784 [Streptomyces purpurascens]